MLTDTAVRNAKPCLKPSQTGGAPERVTGDYKMSDAQGLYLLVKPTGGKYWRVDYRFDGKRQTLSVGTYPETSLQAARSAKAEIRAQIKAGINPSSQRKAKTTKEKSCDTFGSVALEWHKKQSEQWSNGYVERILNLMNHDLLPFIGSTPIGEITAPALLAVLRRMEARGIRETVHKAREITGAIFRFGIATGQCVSNPADSLKGALAAAPVKHRAAVIDPNRFGQLLRDIHAYQGSLVVSCALKLTPLLALRPGELRHLEWSEIHLDNREIRIPATKMKMASPHIVPLSTQAAAILDTLKPFSGGGQYVLPSIRSPRGDRPMSENTVNVALRTLGWDGSEICAHGFRGSFCSIANERLSFSMDSIERQLAHAERSKVRSAYLHSDFLDERRLLMQEWANYLDKLRLQ